MGDMADLYSMEFGPDDGPDNDGTESRFPMVSVVRETPKALLCSQHGVERWIPKSQICKASEVRQYGAFGALVVSDWLADILRIEGWRL